MKSTYQIVNVLFWLSVIFFGLNFIVRMGVFMKAASGVEHMSGASYLGGFIGNLLAAILIPGLLWMWKNNIQKKIDQ